jgi:hypothetical protein
MQEISIAAHTSGGADTTAVVQFPRANHAAEIEEPEVFGAVLQAILAALGGTIVESAAPESGATTIQIAFGSATAALGPFVFRKDVMQRLGIAYQ